MNGLRKQPNTMRTFTDWLAQAFATFTPADLFYQERLVAFNRLSCSEFIESQRENYTFLRELLEALTRQDYQKKVLLAARPIVAADAVEGPATNTLTFINGIWSPAQSHCSALGQGVQLYRLADLPLAAQQELARDCRADLESNQDLFVFLNRLLFQETYLLKIDDQVQLKNIITIQHIITESAMHVVPQLLLKMGKASQATIVEKGYTTSNVAHFGNNLTHITLGEGAQLAYYTSFPFCQVNTICCDQKAYSLFTHYTFVTTSLRMNLTVQLNGSHATAKLYGLYGLSAKDKADYRIQVRHRSPHSLSKQHYKGILDGQSTGAFHGTIYVTPEAQQTNAHQTNNVIILSNAAHHYVKPQLEIYADDVKCSHGATVGQLDPAQLFYLQSRGINADLAKRLLLEAFGREIIDTVPIVALQDYIGGKLLEKLVKL